jgi:hypothetical protein
MNVQAVLVAPADLDEGIFRHYKCAGFGAEQLPEPHSAASPSESASMLTPTMQAIDPNVDDMNGSSLDDIGPEPSFVGLDELGPDEPDGRLEFEDSPALSSDDHRPEKAKGASASSDSMLRAIAQLLVEKGVFSREELVKQLQAMSRPTGAA